MEGVIRAELSRRKLTDKRCPPRSPRMQSDMHVAAVSCNHGRILSGTKIAKQYSLTEIAIISACCPYFSAFILEGYSVNVVLRFVALGPPLSSCEPATRPQCGAFFFLSQRSLVAGSALRRLALRLILVSEPPASLFERPARTVGRVQKMMPYQHLNKSQPRRS